MVHIVLKAFYDLDIVFASTTRELYLLSPKWFKDHQFVISWWWSGGLLRDFSEESERPTSSNGSRKSLMMWNCSFYQAISISKYIFVVFASKFFYFPFNQRNLTTRVIPKSLTKLIWFMNKSCFICFNLIHASWQYICSSFLIVAYNHNISFFCSSFSSSFSSSSTHLLWVCYFSVQILSSLSPNLWSHGL